MDTEPKENSDLLSTRNKTAPNGNFSGEDTPRPAGGGIRALAVVIASFLTNGLLFGVINSYSVIYLVLENLLKNDGDTQAASHAALVGTLAMGTLFFLSPLSGVLTGFMGLRLTAVLGGAIAATGMLISSFVVHSVGLLCFTYGVMYGLGASFAYTPSLAILGHYFKKRLGLVNGIVTIGSSVFTVIMPPIMEYVLNNYGLEWLLRMLAFVTAGVAFCGLLFKPIPLMLVKKPTRENNNIKSLLQTIINVQIWKNRKYCLWALFMPVALFGYFVPYIHIRKFMEQNFVGVNFNLPLQSIALTSGIGRLVFGFLADRPGIDRILLQQIAFYIIGSLTIILPFVRSYALLVVISLGMGICDGAFIALIGPIAIELCGATYAAQAIGCMLGIAAFPLTVGPPIAGYLYTINESYTLPFVLAGISPLVGATLMFTIRFHGRQRGNLETNTNGYAAAMGSKDIEKSQGMLQSNGKAQSSL